MRETVKKSNASQLGTNQNRLRLQVEGNGFTPPRNERYRKEKPLLTVKERKKLEWIGRFGHWRLQCRETGNDIAAGTHVFMRLVDHYGCVPALRLLGRHVENLAVF